MDKPNVKAPDDAEASKRRNPELVLSSLVSKMLI